MNAQAVLLHAAAAGIRLEVEGSDLILEATLGDIPPDLIVQVRSHKPQLLELLRPWDAGDWVAFFDERAAIAEFDGKVARPVAERRACQSCVAEWLNRNPPKSSPHDKCAHCGQPETGGAVILPFGTTTHVWLHGDCWRVWHSERIAHAEKALAAMGVVMPAPLTERRVP
jgi:hypothetical protein